MRSHADAIRWSGSPITGDSLVRTEEERLREHAALSRKKLRFEFEPSEPGSAGPFLRKKLRFEFEPCERA